ncbi:MAG: 2'-5' RNA ligase family protein [Chloroflexi bacterium]|nr:2'-5' RNA ligase family protein [Chloroflexota bacterium]
MKAAFALLVDDNVHNFVRKLAVNVHSKYGIDFMVSLLPPHVSLKQPFEIDSLPETEAYFDQLTETIQPFETTLTHLELQTAPLGDGETGILWLNVQETPTLRELHNRINRELSERFENTDAPFDGPDYHFHATVELGGQPIEVYRKAYAEYEHAEINLSLMANKIAMFYCDDVGTKPGTFITYKILPVGKGSM